MLLYEFIAISHKDFKNCGCPHCGCPTADHKACAAGKADAFTCNKCGRMFVTLKNGIKKSPIPFKGFYPELQAHPRNTIIKKLLLCLKNLLIKKGGMSFGS